MIAGSLDQQRQDLRLTGAQGFRVLSSGMGRTGFLVLRRSQDRRQQVLTIGLGFRMRLSAGRPRPASIALSLRLLEDQNRPRLARQLEHRLKGVRGEQVHGETVP